MATSFQSARLARRGAGGRHCPPGDRRRDEQTPGRPASLLRPWTRAPASLTGCDSQRTRITTVRCQGKGRKERCTQLRRESARLLRRWLRESAAAPTAPLFPNARGGALSRDAGRCRSSVPCPLCLVLGSLFLVPCSAPFHHQAVQSPMPSLLSAYVPSGRDGRRRWQICPTQNHELRWAQWRGASGAGSRHAASRCTIGWARHGFLRLAHSRRRAR
jgi:hypothetical protein